MSIAAVYGLPGLRAAVTAGHRTIFKGGRWDFVSLPVGVKIIDGTNSRDPGNAGYEYDLRAGLLMGKVTTGGKYRPSFIGSITSAYTSGGTTLAVNAATATEVARLQALGGGGALTLNVTGPPSAAGTVAVTNAVISSVTINGASSTLTVTSLGVNKVSGSLIATNDGSQVPITVIPDGWPMKVVDALGVSTDIEFAKLPIGGTIEEANVLPFALASLDSSIRTYIITSMNAAGGGQWIFDGLY